MTEGIISDLDGVLVNTEPIGIKVAIEVCLEYGIVLTEEEKKSFIGIPDKDFYITLLKSRRINLDLIQLLNKHTEKYENIIQINPNINKESLDFIFLIKKMGYKLGLVTGSTQQEAYIILNKIGVYSCFDAIVTIDDVGQGKPNPEGFLLCAKQMNINPNNCLVVEDSLPGITAALLSEMQVVSIGERQTKFGYIKNYTSLNNIVDDLHSTINNFSDIATV